MAKSTPQVTVNQSVSCSQC